ncbi:hypothetical protein DY000_02028093 [Brassica cretica]|uniref:Uncharacterized protein n=1 Tax=Brassica cretica TaxID=69181 RepID=A0ABQ7EMZ7_BRACR|nr:hypothetical protein DY000_02028093 [Brassica cretica]
MNRSNSMSRSLHVFFLDLVTGEVRNPSVIFFFSFLFLLLDLLSRVFDGSTYPFICRSGSLKAISFRSGSTLFPILRSKTKAGAKPLEIPDEPIQFYVQISPCLLSRSSHCRLSWHDSSPKRACGVPVNEARDSVMSWRQRNMKVLARQHEERGYRFRWRGLIVGTAGGYPRFLLIAFDLLNVKVRFILVSFCQRRHGILKTHCFGLVAGDKCHDIADHFSYARSGCHRYRYYEV